MLDVEGVCVLVVSGSGQTSSRHSGGQNSLIFQKKDTSAVLMAILAEQSPEVSCWLMVPMNLFSLHLFFFLQN